MDSALGPYIENRLKALGISIRSFSKKLGRTNSYVSKVIRETKPIPASQIGNWSKALDLDERAAAEFKELALLSLSPVEIRELVGELRRGGAKQQRRKPQK